MVTGITALMYPQVLHTRNHVSGHHPLPTLSILTPSGKYTPSQCPDNKENLGGGTTRPRDNIILVSPVTKKREPHPHYHLTHLFNGETDGRIIIKNIHTDQNNRNTIQYSSPHTPLFFLGPLGLPPLG